MWWKWMIWWDYLGLRECWGNKQPQWLEQASRNGLSYVFELRDLSLYSFIAHAEAFVQIIFAFINVIFTDKYFSPLNSVIPQMDTLSNKVGILSERLMYSLDALTYTAIEYINPGGCSYLAMGALGDGDLSLCSTITCKPCGGSSF